MNAGKRVFVVVQICNLLGANTGESGEGGVQVQSQLGQLSLSLSQNGKYKGGLGMQLNGGALPGKHTCTCLLYCKKKKRGGG